MSKNKTLTNQQKWTSWKPNALQWAYIRICPDRSVHQMYKGSIKGSSPCGRPRNGWHDEVSIDFNEKRISVWEEMALDKKKWLHIMRVLWDCHVLKKAVEWVNDCMTSKMKYFINQYTNIKISFVFINLLYGHLQYYQLFYFIVFLTTYYKCVKYYIIIYSFLVNRETFNDYTVSLGYKWQHPYPVDNWRHLV